MQFGEPSDYESDIDFYICTKSKDVWRNDVQKFIITSHNEILLIIIHKHREDTEENQNKASALCYLKLTSVVCVETPRTENSTKYKQKYEMKKKSKPVERNKETNISI